jgi:hypothetical protein
MSPGSRSCWVKSRRLLLSVPWMIGTCTGPFHGSRRGRLRIANGDGIKIPIDAVWKSPPLTGDEAGTDSRRRRGADAFARTRAGGSCGMHVYCCVSRATGLRGVYTLLTHRLWPRSARTRARRRFADLKRPANKPKWPSRYDSHSGGSNGISVLSLRARPQPNDDLAEVTLNQADTAKDARRDTFKGTQPGSIRRNLLR